MKKIFALIAIAAVLGFAGFLLLGNRGTMPKFRTEKVTKGDIVDSVTATGTMNAVTTVLVGTQVSGTIKDLYVDFNSPVKKGQLIARIDPALFEAQVAQARANLVAAKANTEKAQAALVDARRTYERNKELFSKNLIARSDLDTAETTYETDKAQVGAAKAAVAQAAAALGSAETNLQYTKIISPVDGIVVSRNVDVGQTVAASFQTPTLFTIAQDLTKMQIDTNVAEADVGRIKLNQTVEFTVDAYPEVIFKGKVSQIRISPISVQNVVTYDVVVRVDNPEFKLKPGMTANVSIIVATEKNILKIPNAALRFRPLSRTRSKDQPKGVAVWTVENEKLKRVPIRTGISDGVSTEVVSGVQEGQELVVEEISGSKGQGRSAAPRMF